MRIGVDLACWTNGRGYGRFTRELIRALVTIAPDHEFVCFVDGDAIDGIDLAGPNVELVAVEQACSPTDAAAADGYRSPLDMLRFTRATWAASLDVFFSPSVYTYYPLPPGLAAVVTIHDAIADRFPELTLPTRRARLFWRLKIAMAVHQARIVLTVSEFAARELMEVLELPASRIRVATEAPAAAYRPSDTYGDVAAAAVAAGLPVSAQWFAYVGGFSPHKRILDIVRAHAALVAENRDNAPYLLLIGAAQGDSFLTNQREIRQAISECNTEAFVRWTGYVADDGLRHLLTGASGLLLPSTSEGFGLPAVEAAACGTPVIATVASPLPQLLEGGGIFIEPGDVRALADGMRLLLDKGRRVQLGDRARERAQQLSWARSATATLAALREACA